MDAMLLAAGLGTRLGHLTRTTPKPLVQVGGVPILERVARRLIQAGADRLIINTHHLADQIVAFVRSRDGFGVDVVFSHEPEQPLETGGAIQHAARLFRGDAPFFLHNADVLSDLPLRQVYRQHLAEGPLATLVVMHRETSRYLLFDKEGLVGRVDERKDVEVVVREPSGPLRRLAFTGVHVLSPQFLPLIIESGVFSILDPYLRLAADGHRIEPFLADGHNWIDIGKPEQLAMANELLDKEASD